MSNERAQSLRITSRSVKFSVPNQTTVAGRRLRISLRSRDASQSSPIRAFPIVGPTEPNPRPPSRRRSRGAVCLNPHRPTQLPPPSGPSDLQCSSIERLRSIPQGRSSYSSLTPEVQPVEALTTPRRALTRSI